MSAEPCECCSFNVHPPGILEMVRWWRRTKSGGKIAGPLVPTYCRECDDGIRQQKERDLRELLTGMKDQHG